VAGGLDSFPYGNSEQGNEPPTPAAFLITTGPATCGGPATTLVMPALVGNPFRSHPSGGTSAVPNKTILDRGARHGQQHPTQCFSNWRTRSRSTSTQVRASFLHYRSRLWQRARTPPDTRGREGPVSPLLGGYRLGRRRHLDREAEKGVGSSGVDPRAGSASLLEMLRQLIANHGGGHRAHCARRVDPTVLVASQPRPPP
jgi:hypothetical protein